MTRKRVADKEIVVSTPIPTRRKAASTTRSKRSATPAAAPVTQLIAEVSVHDQIAKLAYSYWLERGCQGGSPEADWLRAEQEMAAKSEKASTASA